MSEDNKWEVAAEWHAVSFHEIVSWTQGGRAELQRRNFAKRSTGCEGEERCSHVTREQTARRQCSENERANGMSKRNDGDAARTLTNCGGGGGKRHDEKSSQELRQTKGSIDGLINKGDCGGSSRGWCLHGTMQSFPVYRRRGVSLCRQMVREEGQTGFAHHYAS